jgi:hypothetical protein
MGVAVGFAFRGEPWGSLLKKGGGMGNYFACDIEKVFTHLHLKEASV